MAARLLARALTHLRDLLVLQVRGWLGAARRALAAAWTTRLTGPRAGAVLLVLGLSLAGTAALLAQAGLPGRLPGPVDWQAAGALLARDALPGDVVVVAPAWLERARQVVPRGVPVLAPARLDGELLPGVTRAWLLSAAAAPRASWEAEAELGRRATRADAQQLGALEAIRFDLSAPALPLASLADHPPPPASAGLREAGGLPRRCLLFTPLPGAPLVLHFPATRVGRTLAGHAQLLPGDGDAPVRLAFQVDGAEVGAVEVRANDGWLPFQIDTSGAVSGAHRLDLVATAAGPPGRTVCLEGVTLP